MCDRNLECWGWNSFGQVSPQPTDSSNSNYKYKTVYPGRDHTCAIKTDDNLVCWGLNYDGRAPSEESDGPYAAVAAGYDHTIAIKVARKGRVMLLDASGQALPERLAIAEGQSRQFVVAVSPQLVSTVTVRLQISPDSEDIELKQTTVTLGAFVSSRTIELAVFDDPLDEHQEVSTMALTSVSPAALTEIDRRNSQVRIVIPANDTPTVTVTPKSFVIEEGEQVVLRLAADKPPRANITFAAHTQNHESRLRFANTITLTPSNFNKTFLVALDNNRQAERKSENRLNLTLRQGAAQANVLSLPFTIAASDTPTLVVTQNTIDILEGTTRTITISAGPRPLDDIAIRLTATDQASGDVRLSHAPLVLRKGASFTQLAWA